MRCPRERSCQSRADIARARVARGFENLSQRAPAAAALRTGLTSPKRAYRRRGVAFGLKIRTLSYAKQAGFRRVLTDNESNHRGMLAINEQLGFVKDPAWVHFAR